jgi:hypothetical protein
MQDDGASEYQQAITDLNETFKTGIKAFAKWYAASWKISRQEWVKALESKPPSDEYIEGFNAGVDAIEVAADSFLGDYHP